jgi:TRAP-type C4-dicarboxylate transport system substrate-binding protein
MRDYDRKALEEVKARGMQVTELSGAEQARMKDKLQPVVVKYSKEFGEPTAKALLAELEQVRTSK